VSEPTTNMLPSAPPQASAAAPVALPDVPEIRAWIESTHQKRAALQGRADRLREQFEPLRKKLAGIERSIKVLDHFLGQITVDGESEDAPSKASRRGVRLLSGKWSRQYDACRACGTDEKSHKAQGYCKGCYDTHVARKSQEVAS
jgi:hypothetical protein